MTTLLINIHIIIIINIIIIMKLFNVNIITIESEHSREIVPCDMSQGE